MLSIVIPAYNESLRLPKTLESIREFLADREYEVIVVDDGSTDGTRFAVEKLGIPQVRCIGYRTNRGKGYALRRGILAAKGERVLLMDADGSASIAELSKLETNSWTSPLVIGSRYIGNSNISRRQPLHRILISRVGNWLIRFLLVPWIRDTQCGFKLIDTTVAKQIVSLQVVDGFGFDIELLHIAGKLWYAAKEVGIVWKDVPGSHFNPWRDIARTLGDLCRICYRSSIWGYVRKSK